MIVKLLSIEFYKSIRRYQLWLFLIVPLYYVISGARRVMNVETTDFKAFFKKGEMVDQAVYFTENANFMIFPSLFLVYPILLGMMVYFLGDLEHKAKAWKYTLTYPMPYWQIFLSKIIVLLFYLTLSIVVNYVCYITCLYAFPYLRPDLPSQAFKTDVPLVTILFFKIYLCCFAVLILNFWLAVFFKNWLSTNIFLPILALVLGSKYFPQNFPLFSFQTDYSKRMLRFVANNRTFTSSDVVIIGDNEYNSLLWSICLIGIGFYISQRFFEFYIPNILTRLNNNLNDLLRKMRLEHLFTKVKLKGYLNIDVWFTLVFWLFIYFAIYYLMRELIETDDLIYKTNVEKWSKEKMEIMLKGRQGVIWQFPLLYSILIFIKILFICFCINLGIVVMEYKLRFMQIFKMVTLFEVVFLSAAVYKFIWFYWIDDYYTHTDVLQFYPLSILNFIHTYGYKDWNLYLLSVFNLFQLVYILLLSWGISLLLDKDFKSSLIFILSTYGAGLMLWVLLNVYFMLMR